MNGVEVCARGRDLLGNGSLLAIIVHVVQIVQGRDLIELLATTIVTSPIGLLAGLDPLLRRFISDRK